MKGPIPALTSAVRLRILALDEAGVEQSDIADMVGVSKSTVARLTPRKKYQVITEPMRQEAIRLCGARVSRRVVADYLGISVSRVDFIVWAAQANGLLPNGLTSDRRLTVDDVPRSATPEDMPEPMWSRARRLAVERRIKARWCWDHIADHCNHLPGPPVSARDVLLYAGRLAA